MLRCREITAVELTRAVLDQIAAHEPRLHAYQTLMRESALDAAAQADEEIAQLGTTKGPLHGVPIAVKDLYAVAGVPNMGGSAALEDNVPSEDCTVVQRLRGEGAVIIGKLKTTEGAMGGYNPLLEDPVPVNPWDATSWAGASSSGSGVATAAGFAYATLGSDTGGSIRFPAAACGTCGIKPTKGLCSRHGVLDLAQTLDHVGPLTRCAADAGIVLQAIAGHDPSDVTSLHAPPPAVCASHPSPLDAHVSTLQFPAYIGLTCAWAVVEDDRGCHRNWWLGAAFGRGFGCDCPARAPSSHRIVRTVHYNQRRP